MDSDFRKPFEYKEDNKGLIILFIIMILVIDPLQTLSFASQEYKYLRHIPVLGIMFLITGGIFFAYTVYTAVVVFRMKGNFSAAAKRYLILRTVYSVLNYIIIFFNILKKENLIGNSVGQYPTFGKMIVGELVVPLLYILSFSIAWYLYFTYSKRCRNAQIHKDMNDET
ncbi:MAG TPA: hypothetical protein PK304_02210 [Mobilitalea sp.]|nr:hypothetical protein [Mobilitalea sp.]